MSGRGPVCDDDDRRFDEPTFEPGKRTAFITLQDDDEILDDLEQGIYPPARLRPNLASCILILSWNLCVAGLSGLSFEFGARLIFGTYASIPRPSAAMLGIVAPLLVMWASPYFTRLLFKLWIVRCSISKATAAGDALKQHLLVIVWIYLRFLLDATNVQDLACIYGFALFGSFSLVQNVFLISRGKEFYCLPCDATFQRYSDITHNHISHFYLIGAIQLGFILSPAAAFNVALFTLIFRGVPYIYRL